MGRPGGNDDRGAILEIILFSIQYSQPNSCLNSDELIYILVGLHTNVLTRRDRHYNQLAMRSCKQNFAEIIILQRFFFDIDHISIHNITSVRSH